MLGKIIAFICLVNLLLPVVMHHPYFTGSALDGVAKILGALVISIIVATILVACL